MNFVSIEGRVLSAALRLHTAIIEKRNSYPILANVRLTVAGSVFKITGTDLDIEATTDLDPIDAGGDWSMCISARLLADIARVGGPEVVRIERVTTQRPGKVEIRQIDAGMPFTVTDEDDTMTRVIMPMRV